MILCKDHAPDPGRPIGRRSPDIDTLSWHVYIRFRPIAMSTLTTPFGLSPLVLLPGAGTELYRGVGAIVLFGILCAAILSLTMLASLTVTVLEWQARRRGKDAAPTSGVAARPGA